MICYNSSSFLANNIFIITAIPFFYSIIFHLKRLQTVIIYVND